jgi:hypothetical protein
VFDIPAVTPDNWSGSVEGSPESAEFIVISVDKNYYDYNILKRDRAGISSGYGVFGSTIMDSCFVYIK